mmetsp:Transcript_32773/g.53938  ORF Transcript_32773/g.53938 Transcript_32773/m.53938 type:complete len:804 (-) Transcript_32773:126-2537(-)
MNGVNAPLHPDSVPPPPEKQLKPAELIQHSWVDYFSYTNSAWLPAVITDVNQESGELRLDIREVPLTLSQVQQLLRRRTSPGAEKLDWLRRCIQTNAIEIEGKKIFDLFATPSRSRPAHPRLHIICLPQLSQHCNTKFGICGMVSLIKEECFRFQEECYLEAWLACFRRHATHVYDTYGNALVSQRAPCRYEDPRGTYDFKHELGRGTFGVVRLAVDPHRNQRAVKEVSKDYIRWLTRGQQNSESEIDILVAMDHPHIVKLYEWYDHLNSIYLVMDFCNGGELAAEINKRMMLRPPQPFAEPQVCDMMKQILSAIAYMHGRGLLHLDIKCDNIMLTSCRRTASPAQGGVDLTLAPAHDRPHVMVIDLGIGLFIRPGNLSAGAECPRGTPYAMAPEIWSMQFTTAADVFGTGVVFFSLMSFSVPFGAVPCGSIAEAVAFWSTRPQAKWNLLRHYSDNAVQLCKAMLNQNRQLRPSASDCLASAFIRPALGAGLPVSAHLQERIEQIRKLPRRSLLYRSVALAIAQNWPSNQFPSGKRVWDHMDAEGRGQLNCSRITAVLIQQFGINETEAVSASSAMALSRKGIVYWTEFVAASIDLGDASLEKDLRNVFKQADGDGDGRLSQTDVGTMLAGQHLQGQALFDIFRDLSGSSDPTALVDWPMFRNHFRTPIRERLPAPPGEANEAEVEEPIDIMQQMALLVMAAEDGIERVRNGVAGLLPEAFQMPLLDAAQTPARGPQHPPAPQGLPASGLAPGTPRQAPGTPRVTNPLVRDLMAMGFRREKAEEAAKRCSSAEAAIDWLSSNA